MSERVPFKYGEFYDVPRQMKFRLEGVWYFLRSGFDEQLDDYPNHYNVYILDHDTPYLEIDFSKVPFLGKISVESIGLDLSRRKSIDGELFRQWLRHQKPDTK